MLRTPPYGGIAPTPAQCWIAAQRLALGDSVELAAGIARCEIGQLRILAEIDPEFQDLVADARRLALMPEKEWQARVRAQLRFATERALAEEKVSFVNLATRLTGSLAPARDEHDVLGDNEVYRFFRELTLEQFADYKSLDELDKGIELARAEWAAKAAAIRAAQEAGPSGAPQAEPAQMAAAPDAAPELDPFAHDDTDAAGRAGPVGDAPIDAMKAAIAELCPLPGAASPGHAPVPDIAPPPPPADPWPCAPPPNPVAEARAARPAPAGKTTVPATPTGVAAAGPPLAGFAAGGPGLTAPDESIPPWVGDRGPRAWYPARGP